MQFVFAIQISNKKFLKGLIFIELCKQDGFLDRFYLTIHVKFFLLASFSSSQENQLL